LRFRRTSTQNEMDGDRRRTNQSLGLTLMMHLSEISVELAFGLPRGAD
jgi:hypothetical protein